MLKKILSVFLSALMVFSTMPIGVIAETTQSAAAVTEALASGDLSVTPDKNTVRRGDEVTFTLSIGGTYSSNVVGIDLLSEDGAGYCWNEDVFEGVSGEWLKPGILADVDLATGSAVNLWTTAITIHGDIFELTLRVKEDAPFGEYAFTPAYAFEGKNSVRGSANISVVEKFSQEAPAAPTVATIGDTTIALNAIDGAEYSFDGITWQSSCVFEDLVQNTTYTFYQRMAETETHFASPISASVTATTLKSSQSTPPVPAVSARTDVSITLVAVEGAEYSLDDKTWQSSPLFEGLSPMTSYTFYQRMAETETHYASAIVSASLETDKADPYFADVVFPEKTQYFIGDEFSFDGFSATYYGEDGKPVSLSAEDVSFAGFVSFAAGNYTIEISYNGLAIEYEIVVSAKASASATVGRPGKTFEVVISLDDSVTFFALGVEDIEFDSDKIQLISAEWLSKFVLEDFDLEKLEGVASFDTAQTFSGDLLKLTFKVNENVPDQEFNFGYNLVLKAPVENGETVAKTIPVVCEPGVIVIKDKLEQPAPEAPVAKEIADTTVTLNTLSGAEYSLDGVNWQESPVFTDLKQNTTYTFYQRMAETETHYASLASEAATFTTIKSQQTAPTKPAMASRTDVSITLVAVEGAEYSLDGKTWQSSTLFEGLSPMTSYTFYQRMAETDTHYASDASSASLETDKADPYLTDVTYPEKLDYLVGEEFVSAGLSATYYGEDGKPVSLSASDFTVTGFDSSAAGTVVITASYKEVSAEFEVTVYAKAILTGDKVKPGETVDVYLSFENAPNAHTIAVDSFVFDSEKLELVGAEWIGDFILDDFRIDTLEGVAVLTEDSDLNTKVLKLTFLATEEMEDAKLDVFCNVILKKYASDGSGLEVEIPLQVVSGVVDVKNYVVGDLNEDELVTADDAIYLLYYTVFPSRYPINQPCDFDGDGQISAGDAIYLLYYTVFPSRYPLEK